MNGLQKILVVDNGERACEGALSVELAELGFASVTTPLEAADEVLATMPSPVAVLLQMPRRADLSERQRFQDLARRLRKTLSSSGVPVILTAGMTGIASVLQNELGAHAVGL
ncbi:hypothetical protein [Microvirga alba]|uniref:Uncharacterized protein n=1 Tax=Microvirga alba TaxID=2791025 RepID=A0A931FTC6_9HYPH|nr:hypothetical protein [Microvirga alba]MBF9234561.1 hypothetical protein [Microvirga alba]